MQPGASRREAMAGKEGQKMRPGWWWTGTQVSFSALEETTVYAALGSSDLYLRARLKLCPSRTRIRIWAHWGPYLENALGFLVPGVSLCNYWRALILVENYSEFQMLSVGAQCRSSGISGIVSFTRAPNFPEVSHWAFKAETLPSSQGCRRFSLFRKQVILTVTIHCYVTSSAL
jgi:hypothetical protein